MSALEQAIPVGFKQTEVGIIPQEWQVLTIDEAIASKMILDQMDGNHGELYPKSHEFKDDGIPYVGATDFYSGKIDYKHCKRLPLKRAKLFKKGVAKDGDVLFAHNATVGPSSIVETHEDFIIISTTATYYRCNSEQIKNTYLLNFFRSKLFENQYSSVMSQSTRNQVPILAQRKFYLALPHIKEQTAIANALSDVDALLAELEKLIAKKQAIITATMQQLLTGKTRLPQFATYSEGEKQGQQKDTKSSELGEIPENWVVATIGDFAPLQRGFDLTNSDRREGIYPVVYSNGIVNHHSEYQVKGPGVVTGRSGTLGKVHYIDSDYWPHNTSLWVTKFEIAHPKYVYYLFKFIGFERFASGSGVPTLNRNDAHDFKIAAPSTKKEQNAIATILSDMDNEIQTLEQRLAKTRQIKQGMMQELLTGRTRLPFKQAMEA